VQSHFAKYTSLKSFHIPQLVRGIGTNCFDDCIHLSPLKFRSSECLERVVRHRSLDEALSKFGLNTGSSLCRIDIEDGGVELGFSGWMRVPGGDGDIHPDTVLVQYHQYLRRITLSFAECNVDFYRLISSQRFVSIVLQKNLLRMRFDFPIPFSRVAIIETMKKGSNVTNRHFAADRTVDEIVGVRVPCLIQFSYPIEMMNCGLVVRVGGSMDIMPGTGNIIRSDVIALLYLGDGLYIMNMSLKIFCRRWLCRLFVVRMPLSEMIQPGNGLTERKFMQTTING
jgi:hypothetical protein